MRLVLLVHGPVAAQHLERQVGIEAREGIQGVVHHANHELAEIAQLPVAAAGQLARRQPRGDRGDLLALIADALQIGDGLEDGDDQTQIRGGGAARGEDAVAVLVDMRSS